MAPILIHFQYLIIFSSDSNYLWADCFGHYKKNL